MQINIPLILSLLSVSQLALGDKAPKIKKNPKNVVAIADFPFGFDNNVQGNIVFTAKRGKAVNVHVDVTGLPKEGGPFQYHIHENLVPSDGNCDLVGLHFNPYDAPPDCEDQKDDSYCQVGDLSGKHGWIDTTCFETKYNDPYLSLNKKSNSYIVGRSVTFHFANLTKFACADIELASNIRLQSLQDEYNSNSNYDLQELQKDLASGLEFNQDYKEYSYDEDEVDKYEVFDEGPDADDEPEVEDSKPENDYADDDEDNTEDTKSKTKLINDVKSRNTTHNATHPHNGTDLIHNGNHSNVSLNEYNSETESGSSTFGLSISLMIGLGVVTGLLI
jgi:Cu-Zn family superoxide dismutase